MPRKAAELTDNQREFLAAYARCDEGADRMEAYRASRCAGHDGTEQSVKRLIERLVARPDAKLVLGNEGMRRRIQIANEMARADSKRADALISAEDGKVLANQVAVVQMLEEQARLEADPKRSLSGLGKLFGEYMKANQAVAASDGETAEDADAIDAEIRRREQAEQEKAAATLDELQRVATEKRRQEEAPKPARGLEPLVLGPEGTA